jgi:phosphatidyl-myo-inositol alpha-mannosyltransferase
VSAPASDPVRVALLNFAFWPEVRRGSERVVHDLAVDLLRQGHAPRVITSHPGRPSTTVEDGFTIRRNWRPPDALLRARKVDAALTHLPFTYSSLVRGDDHLAHAFYPTDALAAIRWARRTGRPSIFAHMGIPRREVLATPRGRMRIIERATTGADCVTVLSKAAQEGMWRWLGVESRLIHPGVDLGEFSLGGARDEDPVIACPAAPADSRKRIDLLVRAFAHVRRERPRARLLLEQPQDPGLAQSLAANAGVELFPRDTPISSIFQRAWVSALTSRDEAFGLVLVEALACGRPVVGTDDGGIPEIIDRPEVGRLFQGADERAAARALLEALELAEDPGTESACRAHAERFSSTASAQRYADLYAELLRE